MSHALRTPLNAIIGFTGTLLMQLPGPLNDDQREQLELVKTSARQQLALINDLLDMVKIETGTYQINAAPDDVGAAINAAAASFQPLAVSKGLSFVVQIPDGETIVKSDHHALRRIITKLVSNAIRFTSQGGVRIDLRRENGATEITVGDTGIGIATEDQPQLFVPFSRVGHDEISYEEGTGVGLHLSQKLAGLLNACITVKSAPGHGSKFTLRLNDQVHGNS
jgi:signal transduction histidine kinase